MKPKNKYYNLTHISERKFREILRYFCEDITATKAAKLSSVSRNSVNKIYGLLRERIAHESISNTPELGEFEVDESYFGAKRVRGKGSRFAINQGPFRLAYTSSPFPGKSEARKREAQIKRWSREKKEKLIKGEWE